MADRRCAHCAGPIRPDARRDARYCGKLCRQAAHRIALEARALQAAAHPMRLAYADPPYPGMADLYRGHPDYGGEVDHRELLQRLHREYDGWALSTSAWALPAVLVEARDLGIRPAVAAWMRGSRPTPARRPLSSWEPIIYVRARSVLSEEPGEDSLILHPQPRRRDPRRVIGAKPAGFCAWVLNLLGAASNDTFEDLFPGSGIAGRVWELARGAA
jgi:hypothetical protein